MDRTSIAFVSLLPIFSLACRSEADITESDRDGSVTIADTSGTIQTMDPSDAYDVEGSWMGELATTDSSDELEISGEEVNIIVRILNADDKDATGEIEVDVSMRIGFGEWMQGEGVGSQVGVRVGEFDVVVESHAGDKCVIEGDWSGEVGIVGADITCIDANGTYANYDFVADRF